MVAYPYKAKEQLSVFSIASIEVIPRSKNSNADALAKLALTMDANLLDVVSMEFLVEPSIHPQKGVIELSWKDPTVVYLKTSEQPEDKIEA